MTSPEPGRGVAAADYERYLEALLAGDRAICASIVRGLLDSGIPLRDLYVQVFQRSLYKVGEMWESQRISVAVEHLATAITERLLTLVQPEAFAGPPRGRSIVVASAADEHHQVGARMVADLCEVRGWRAYFLGSRLPSPDLLKMIEDHKPDAVGLSVSLLTNLPPLLQTLDSIRTACPDLKVLVGGQAFRWGGLSALDPYPGVRYLASLDELEIWLAAHER